MKTYTTQPTNQESASFDLDELYVALDARRRKRRMSWAQVAREMGDINPSTLTGMRKRRALEGDGVLAMLRWLGRSAESFVPGHPAPKARMDIPRGRFDARVVHAALDAQRRDRRMTWHQVAAENWGFAAPNLTRFAGGGRLAFPSVMRIVVWLGQTVAEYTRNCER